MASSRQQRRVRHPAAQSGRPIPSDTMTRATVQAGTRMQWSAEAIQAREQAREEERRRLARDLHDELGQALTGLKLDLRWLDDRLRDSDVRDAHAKVVEILPVIDQAISTVRSMITELRPQALDQLGLVAALQWQTETFARRFGLRCQFTTTTDTIDLDAGRSTAIFRMFQEMLSNVVRHARASRVTVDVGADATSLRLTVCDNGRGVERHDRLAPSKYGLLGMRERALLLGGQLEVMSAPRRGTTVTVRVPLANRRTAARSRTIGVADDSTADR
jgi:signal transduction histidine kinase